MTSIRSYIISALMGLLIYASIVAVNDSAIGIYWLQRPTRQIVIEVVSCIVLGLVYNLVLHGIIHLASKARKAISPRTILWELLIVVVVSVLIFNPGLYLIHYLFGDDVDTRDLVIGNVLVVPFILIQYLIVRGYRVMKSYAEQQLELERVANNQLQTELKFLKSQYHPHFLFNALNTVYFQMDESVADAKKTIERLSGLLRYQLNEHQHPVRLSAEVDYLENFVAFMKERANPRLKLTVKIEALSPDIKVYPLILQPLVENAFKYVGGDYELMISLEASGGYLRFEVVNSIGSGQPAGGTGIGLANLRRRLELLYPGRFELVTGVANDRYEASLKLDTIR